MTSSRQIPWARILVEGVVVVISILLAFGIDAWWDQRQGRDAERVLLAGLVNDFEATMRIVEEDRDRLEEAAGTTEELMSFGASRRTEISAARADTLLAQALPGRPFLPADASLTALVNSGGLSLISNPELRAKLVEWPRLVGLVRRSEDQNQSQFNNHFLPYLYSRVPIRTLDAIGTPESGAHPSAFTRDVRELMGDLTFENHLNDMLFYSRRRIAVFGEVEGYITETLSLVRAELN